MYRIALNVAISFYRRASTRTWYVISEEEHLLEASLGTAVTKLHFFHSRGRALTAFLDRATGLALDFVVNS
jgi:DNA-directed RNA polymerase specialized sigma24 family protein